ncbi:cytochrome P450 [Bailinhaonella thermotolerans]|uniref:Cytochrome P450 n=1 Tax=Bailinhaonella thermotolerans TaxID=1070861 RepID=A0A3A4AD42_9ACTN|nr:cytochrome P450 [Bailinhaonella thermotolerans]RJL27236.1 cytochrome P450 [Bailinhaonella thermotolerans]
MTDVAFLNLMDPAFRVDSPDVRAAAERHWYAQTPMGPAVLAYDDCVELVRDRRLRQVGLDHIAMQGVSTGLAADWWGNTLISLEGETHHRQRRLLAKAFTPRRVEALRPWMRTIVTELIDELEHRGECEFMADFADRYPPRVMYELLGLPEEEHAQFLRWGKDLAGIGGMSVAENRPRIEAALAGLYDATDRLCAERRAHPRDDLLTALVQATEEGDRLSMQELRYHVAGFVFGGQDTTRNQLGLGMYVFTRHPDQWALLAERPDLAANAVEEVMRVAPTVPIIWRVATEDISYRDLEIPAGTRLWLFVATAHQEAGPFDITRESPPQLTFGGGVHHCLGAMQARAELSEALPLLAARLGPVELAGEPQWRSLFDGLVGPISLPIRYKGAT